MKSNCGYGDFGFNLPVFICIVSAVFSPLMVYRYHGFFSVLLFFFWLLIGMAERKKLTVSEICTIFFYSYLVVMPYIMGYGFVSNRYLVLAVFLMGNLTGGYCEFAGKWKNIGIVLKAASPFMAYVYIKTFFGLLAHPWIARMVKNDDAYTIQARLQGVGGYEFIYFLAMLTGISAGLFFLLKKRRHKWICLGICMSSYLEVVLSNYMTAFLISTLGIVLTVLLFLINKNRAWILFFSFCIVFFLAFGNHVMNLAVDILQNIIPENGMTFLRLQNMRGSFLQMLAEEFLSDRSPVLVKSIRCFFQYPLFGIISRSGLGREELLSFIGQHSYFFDTFAFYGGPIGILSLYSYFSIFRKKYFHGNLIVITLPVLVCGSVLLFFNNVTVSAGIVTGIIYPYALYLVREQTGQNRKEEIGRWKKQK